MRLPAGTGTGVTGTDTVPPESSVAGKLNVAVAARVPGFWIVRYSTNPGRTVPSAKWNDCANDGDPTTS